ncbi:PPOX class F420-dependent enzyme [Rhodococcus sp. WMMA185]|uniref:PPOX class F420-dependent oxidoreductase n=1 Tax=Rhodococcus sp. WMMA185 TaxID=679318 RepID=UPI00087861D3|nr:PPOX class F420-dependent oxidoreductase [Rhodococcus sp. WMMA185]AOW92337.1 PPOX class F420-dependent enzyme [Rhodococcus sp. WMMA185]
MGTNQRAQITMTDSEITEFVNRSRIATLATVGADGRPHLVAMWYGVVDGEILFETKTKSQKAVNLRRDDRVTVMIEDGDTYDTLRGISIDGSAEVVEDPDAMFAAGVSVWERYTGPYSDDLRPAIEQLLHNRVVVRVVPQRIRSWDHTKLGLPPMPVGGSTAEFSAPADGRA